MRDSQIHRSLFRPIKKTLFTLLLVFGCRAAVAHGWIAFEAKGPTGSALLVATVHAWPDKMTGFPNPNELPGGMEGARLVLVEADFFRGDADARFQAALLDKMGGRSIAQIFDRRTVARVRASVKASEMKLDKSARQQFERLHPVSIYWILACDGVVGESDGYRAIDYELYSYAEARNMQIDTLETAESQASWFATEEPVNWRAALRTLPADRRVCDPSRPDGLAAAVSAAYSIHDERLALSLTEVPAYLPWGENHFVARERRMVQRILDEMSKGGRIVVAVGWRHLAGRTSIPAMLRNSGLQLCAYSSRIAKNHDVPICDEESPGNGKP
jgi:uncharacterized protein YbaP (TraB family)